jgi:hypothetical protein
MNCRDMDKALIAGPSSPDVQAHLRDCARCRELAGPLTVPDGSPSPEILRQIKTALLDDLRPVCPIASQRRLSVALIAIFVFVAAIGGFVLGAFALVVMSPLQIVVMLGVLAISSGLLSYSLVKQMVPGSLHWVSPRVLPFGILISFTIAALLIFQFEPEQHFWTAGWSCIRAGTPLGAIAAIPLWFVLRRGAILSPALTGAATGLLAGLVGTTALEIHCPNLDVRHILVAHLGVAVLGAVAGFVLGSVTRARVERRELV